MKGLVGLLVAGVVCVGIAWSQVSAPNASLAALTLTPQVCEKNDTITLTFKPSSPQRDSRFDVVITDAYRGAQLVKAGREFRPDAAGLRLALSFRADAGIYAVQLFEGKNAVSEKAFFIVPGVDRVARKAEEDRRRRRRGQEDEPKDETDEGWWLVNGYPISGFIWGYSARPPSMSSLIRPSVMDGVGFNTVTFMPRSPDWSLRRIEPQGAFSFLYLESLLFVGLHSLNVAPMLNQQGEKLSAGCFNAPENRAHLVEVFKRLRDEVADDGTLPRSFLGFQLFRPRLPDNTYTCYCRYCAEEFRASLKERYTDVGKFNTRHRLNVSSFNDVDPPRNPNASSTLWNDWQDFRFQIVPRFATWLKGEMTKLFPERALVGFAGSMLSLSKESITPGVNPLEGVDELAMFSAFDVLGAAASADDVADRTDLLVAASDPDLDGYPNKPVWVTYENTLSRVEAIAHGASGTFRMGKWENGKMGNEVMPINRLLNQYANLFTGARVIGEVGVVVPRATLKYGRDAQVVRSWEATLAGINAALQRNHRTKRIVFPERGISWLRQPSTLIVPLGEMVSSEFLNQLKTFVEEGGSVYLEGLPLRDETGTAVGDRLKDLIGAEVEEVPLRASEMTVDDVWVFGTANKMRLPIQVRGNVKKLIEKTPEKKGKNEPPPEKARVIATLPDGSPAVIVNEFGKQRSLIKGTVIYTPNFIVRDAALAYLDRASQTHDPATPLDQRYVEFYGAIADYLTPPLVRLKGNNTGDVRVGVLLSSRNTVVVGLVNHGSADKSLELFVRTRVSEDDRDFNEVNVFDLRSQEWLKPLPPPTAVVRLNYELAAHDWTFLVFTNHRRTSDFEKEVSEPRGKITLR